MTPAEKRGARERDADATEVLRRLDEGGAFDESGEAYRKRLRFLRDAGVPFGPGSKLGEEAYREHLARCGAVLAGVLDWPFYEAFALVRRYAHQVGGLGRAS